ncbi:hypothetical protein SLEP1_g57296 [Rubroshorea leprosula]|uniref:Uncharacterized protein n=1 Tax=Rubroshorea leprosula TaxID=152421 RepID=A0AAV5MMD9_9ROSI|nr:hypothetical protein SLEP1_g57296 [Rubroshorea leprosula]
MRLFPHILGKLATIISKEAEREVKLVTGVEKEINKLSSNLESIEALLQDADERQIKDRSIRSWLTKLKDVCYDMEDVLDEWNTALLKFEVDEADLENSDLSKGKGKKVFLVLDDLWSDESKRWEQLNQGFKPAASGSRILVTTRKNTVAKAMNSVCKFSLKQLTDSVCWKIISQEAFVGRDKEQCKSLEDIGKEIAKRCSGLPLVAKTLGGMLRFKKTSDDWKNILDSDKWQLDLVEKEVYVPLLLSFYDLPSAVRRCFLYCSIFPKDFLIVREDVIYQWMAQGYLSSDKNAEKEITGAECFDCLVERSFFQDLEIFEDGSIWRCKIHDITVDFARFFMGNEFMSKDLHSDVELSLEKTRHLLVRQMSGTSFPMLLGAENLRGLTIFYIHEKETSQQSLTISDIHEKETSQALCKLFIEPNCVRSLNFYWGRIDGLPKEVGKLLHLRSLNLSYRELPNKMEKLVNLRHLDMTGCSSLTFFPRGIGRLTSLRDLWGIKVGLHHTTDGAFRLGDLENLCHLRVLMMKIVGSKIDANEARQAKLQSKIHLKDLELILDPWHSHHGDYFIEVLNPPSHTKVRTGTVGRRELSEMIPQNSWSIYQLDVKSAFLHGNLQEQIFIDQPPGYVKSGSEHKVYRLKKALYGLKQAPRAWYSQIDAYFLKEGFQKCSYEHTLYIKFGDGDLGLLHYFLGLEVVQSDSGIFVCQKKYVQEVLDRFQMKNCNSVTTPVDKGVKLVKDPGGRSVDSKLYKQIVGSLMYLTATRPDIMHGVSLISRYMEHPKELRLQTAKRMLRYLCGTADFGLFYKKGDQTHLAGFTDSDYAGDLDDRKSTSGFVFMLGSGAISWSSKKQPIVTFSTTKAEYVAATSCACQAIWLRRIMEELELNQHEATSIYCDNSSAIKLSKNPVLHGRSKHIHVRYHFLRNLVEDGTIELIYCRTEDQVADIFTKPLKVAAFSKLRELLGVCSMQNSV